MGYPMTYRRAIGRNHLFGGYDDPRADLGSAANLPGDLRRLEADQRDDWHLARYAELAGVTKEQAKLVLDAFFDGFPGSPATVSPSGGRRRRPADNDRAAAR